MLTICSQYPNVVMYNKISRMLMWLLKSHFMRESKKIKNFFIHQGRTQTTDCFSSAGISSFFYAENHVNKCGVNKNMIKCSTFINFTSSPNQTTTRTSHKTRWPELNLLWKPPKTGMLSSLHYHLVIIVNSIQQGNTSKCIKLFT